VRCNASDYTSMRLSKDIITTMKGATNEWHDSVLYSEGNDPLYGTLLTHGGNVTDYVRRVKNVARFFLL